MVGRKGSGARAAGVKRWAAVQQSTTKHSHRATNRKHASVLQLSTGQAMAPDHRFLLHHLPTPAAHLD